MGSQEIEIRTLPEAQDIRKGRSSGDSMLLLSKFKLSFCWTCHGPKVI